MAICIETGHVRKCSTVSIGDEKGQGRQRQIAASAGQELRGGKDLLM